MFDVCECGRPHPLHVNPPSQFSEAEREALTEALCRAFEQSAPVLSQALSAAIQAQFERVIGHGVLHWLRRILIAGLFALAGYTFNRGPDHS